MELTVDEITTIERLTGVPLVDMYERPLWQVEEMANVLDEKYIAAMSGELEWTDSEKLIVKRAHLMTVALFDERCAEEGPDLAL